MRQSVLLQKIVAGFILAVMLFAPSLAAQVQAHPAASPAAGWNGSAYTGLKAPFLPGTTKTVTGDRGTHAGSDRHAVDIGMNKDMVLAIAGGTVMGYVPNNGLAGNSLYINHGDGYCSAYLHLLAPLVKVGDPVKQGQNIAISGNSSNQSLAYHLHVEVDQIVKGSCNTDNPKTPEVPMFFDEIPGRELKQYDSLTSQNSYTPALVHDAVYAIQSALPTTSSVPLTLDVWQGNLKNETPIIQWEYHGGQNQQWIAENFANGFTRFHSAMDARKCLVVQYASKDNGGKIILNDCSPSGQGNEWWAVACIDSNCRVVNQGSGRALDVPGGKTDLGLQAQQWDFNGTPAQQWRFKLMSTPVKPVENGVKYAIYSANTPDAVLDVWQLNTANETPVVQWGYHGNANQLWIAETFPSGYVRFHSALDTRKCLVVQYASKDNGAKIILNDCSPSGQGNEWWTITRAGSNFTLMNVGSGRMLDVPGAKTEWGLQMQQYQSNGSLAQQWILKPVK